MTTSTGTARQYSDDLAAAVERAAAWTITVDARRRFPASGILWSADGLIVTADHVIEHEDAIHVTLPGREQTEARLIGRDPGADLALLQVEGATEGAELAPVDGIRVGHVVMALGRPSGSVQASIGIVSALGGPWRSRSGSQVDATLRSDSTLFSGFSGGPLIDVEGRVVGLNSSRFRGGNLTIVASAVTSIVALLRDHGRVRRAYLGIASQAVRLPEQAGQEAGLLIVNVEANSPAGRAGLLVGDVLLSIEDTSTLVAGDLQGALGPERVGAAVRLQVLRGGVRQEVAALLAERP